MPQFGIARKEDNITNTPVDNILSQSVSDVAARNDVVDPSALSRSTLRREITPPERSTLDRFRASAEFLRGSGRRGIVSPDIPLTLEETGGIPSVGKESEAGFIGPPRPVQDITGPVQPGTIEALRRESIIAEKGISPEEEIGTSTLGGLFERFRQLEKTAKRGLGRRRSKGVRPADIQNRIKFLQERAEIIEEGPEKEDIIGEISDLSQLIQGQFGITGLRKGRAKERLVEDQKIKQFLAEAIAKQGK